MAKTRTSFKKGEGGRTKGSKNKNCMNPVIWFNMIMDISSKMPDERKLAVAFKALELMMPKVNNLPSSPIESNENAIAAQNLLRAMELESANREPKTAGS